MYTDIEKAVILEEIANSGYDEDIQELLINEAFHPEKLREDVKYVCKTPEELDTLWESWLKEWEWDGKISPEFKKGK